jgi:hypothetical protein
VAGNDEAMATMAEAGVTACRNDIASGNLSRWDKDLQYAQGSAYQIGDDVLRARIQDEINEVTAQHDALSPAAIADNTATWEANAADVSANVARLNNDEVYLAQTQAENQDLVSALTAKTEGKDPALAYNGIPDPGGFGTALNLSKQSPKPGLQGITPGGWAFLGGSTLLVALALVAVGIFYFKVLK